MVVDANILPSINLFGKSVTDLQSNVKIVDRNKVSGTLKYVTGYTGFSSKVEEQSGNYLVLHASADEGAVITAEYVGGSSTDVITLDEDGILVSRIVNATGIRFTATKGSKSDSFIYDLSMLGKESA